ncbi:IS3 family transposase [Cyanobium sp. WAJ14-Wanaka]|uniref:IS3 family transposase n=1 Tax=Cyanobium sp. WAJ14-Wanaka TaxID=2823725 RepID=UPI0020CBA83E|nr:IS3 family transposase [Cyanobium sp. WAJ14-Wanaka]
MLGGRGRLTNAAHRQKAIELITEANATGARLLRACCEIGISLRTLKRWRKAFAGDGDGEDRRKGSLRLVSHRLTGEERQRILLTCNQAEYASLPPAQIVPALADQGLFIGSESSLYRVLHQAGQCHRRGRARLPQEPRSVPRLMAAGPNRVWSWDITYLPTTVRGIWLYLYLVIDVWSRKVVAWDIAEREDPAIAADLVSRACLRERISKGRKQPLILHADNGNAMRAATLESRLEELGVLRSFSRPRVSNDNPYSESLFRTVKYRPDYPSRPFASKDEACQWVVAFVDWYNHRHRHSGIKFVTPHQRHSGAATAICQQRIDVYEKARRANPSRWSRQIRCWRQPAEVWINKPPEEPNSIQPVPLIQAALVAA